MSGLFFGLNARPYRHARLYRHGQGRAKAASRAATLVNDFYGNQLKIFIIGSEY
jgi:hypothetical protein